MPGGFLRIIRVLTIDWLDRVEAYLSSRTKPAAGEIPRLVDRRAITTLKIEEVEDMSTLSPREPRLGIGVDHSLLRHRLANPAVTR
jgi:hypothetical protein